METLANAFQKLPNGINKAALAQKLFGRAGQGLLPILNQGKKGMDDMLNSASKLVPPVAKNARSAGALMRSERELHAAMLGLQVSIGSALIPILNSLAKVVQPIAEWFDNAMAKSKAFHDAIYILTGAIGGLLVATKLFIPLMRALGLSELAAEAPIAPWVAVIGALAVAFYLAYHHVKWFRDIVNSVVDFLKKNWKTAITIAATMLLGPFVGAIVLVITHLKLFEGIASSVVSRVKTIFSGLVTFFTGLPGKISRAVSGAFKGLYNAAWTVVKQIGQMFANLGSKIASTISHAISSAPSSLLHSAEGLLTGKAAGGPISQTGPYLVGERGPEVVTLTRGQTVIPNHQLAAAGGRWRHDHRPDLPRPQTDRARRRQVHQRPAETTMTPRRPPPPSHGQRRPQAETETEGRARQASRGEGQAEARQASSPRVKGQTEAQDPEADRRLQNDPAVQAQARTAPRHSARHLPSLDVRSAGAGAARRERRANLSRIRHL